jgi:hypothetical protein
MKLRKNYKVRTQFFNAGNEITQNY